MLQYVSDNNSTLNYKTSKEMKTIQISTQKHNRPFVTPL